MEIFVNRVPAIWLLQRFPVTCAARRALMDMYGCPYNIHCACERRELDETLFKEEDIKRLYDTDLTEARTLAEEYENRGINVYAFGDAYYPAPMVKEEDPPVALFVKGKLPELLYSPSVTIVGTRNCSEYGKKVAARLAYDLSANGITVVSGMARGIDSYAHKGALLAGNAPTIAVLAGSVEVPYPPENKELYEMICEKGAVVSEMLPGSKIVGKWAFPLRNRILVGMTLATVVVESGTKGGSMITAKIAKESNKVLFAVPSEGSPLEDNAGDELIRQGAIRCASLQDILTHFDDSHGRKKKWQGELPAPTLSDERLRALVARMEEKAARSAPDRDTAEPKPAPTEKRPAREKKPEPKTKQPPVSLTETEESIYRALGESEMSADTVCEKLGLFVPDVIMALQSLEMKGLVTMTPGGIYQQK